ncbi:MAG: right-handed parallel beta-helix repeat-containing protein [Kiritimatiellae bacterium]|nr:right-handed parallel beta-helix repeat-containing protein [Kiritimatiellia bacterium]
MHRQELIRAAVSLIVLQAVRVLAATYVVAPGGHDGNPGTEAQPWATLKRAAQDRQPGDIVRIRAGVYAERPTWKVTAKGTRENPITYKAYGDGEVRITPSSVLPAAGWSRVRDGIYRIDLKKAPLSVFCNGLPLVNPSRTHPIKSVDKMYAHSFFTSGKTLYVWLADGSDPNGADMRTAPDHVVNLRGCDYTVFDGLTLEYGKNGFKGQAETRHITIRHCTLRSLASQGIQPTPADCLVEHCLFQKIGSTKYQHGIYGSGPGLTVRHSVFEDIAGCGIHQYGKPDDDVPGGRFYGNIFRSPRAATDPKRERYMADLLLWARAGNIVYNNVFYGEGKRPGISLKKADNRIFNNTFVDSATGVSFGPKSTGNVIQNNIFVDSGQFFLDGPAGATPQTLDHNIYFRRAGTPQWRLAGAKYADFGAYRKANGGEQNSLYADPRLVGAADAHLQPGSPARDAAVVLAEINADKDGVARPQGKAPDVGAYEFKAAR